jgi:hypothetical protein
MVIISDTTPVANFIELQVFEAIIALSLIKLQP